MLSEVEKALVHTVDECWNAFGHINFADMIRPQRCMLATLGKYKPPGQWL